MPGPKPPKVQVGDLIALAFDRLANFLGHARIGRAIEQDAAGIAQQPNRPVGDNERADQAGQRVHPDPAECARQQQPDNDQNGYGGIGQDMNDGGPHIVVAVMRAMRGRVIAELDAIEFLAMMMIMIVAMRSDHGCDRDDVHRTTATRWRH